MNPQDGLSYIYSSGAPKISSNHSREKLHSTSPCNNFNQKSTQEVSKLKLPFDRSSHSTYSATLAAT
ncbi:hypothetical protein P3S68_003619 [Capsicum galapagoense]